LDCMSGGKSAAGPHHRANTRGAGRTGPPPSNRSNHATVTVARADFDGSAWLVAMTWKVPVVWNGARYLPRGGSDGIKGGTGAISPPSFSSTDQVTCWLGLPLTVAVKSWKDF